MLSASGYVERVNQEIQEDKKGNILPFAGSDTQEDLTDLFTREFLRAFRSLRVVLWGRTNKRNSTKKCLLVLRNITAGGFYTKATFNCNSRQQPGWLADWRN